MIKRISEGIGAYFTAFRLVSKLNLWKYIIFPGILSILLGGGVLLLAFGLGSQLSSLAIDYYPFEWGAAFIQKVSVFIGGTLIGASSLFLYKYLVMILVAPFMGPLSERIEAHYLGENYQSIPFNIVQIIKDISRSLYISFRNIFRELFFIIVIFILSFIPVVNLIAAIFLFSIESYYAGFGNMDITLERHLSKISKRISYVKRYKGIAIGNGIGFVFLLAIPVVGFFLAPALGVISATNQTLKQLDKDGLLRTNVDYFGDDLV